MDKKSKAILNKLGVVKSKGGLSPLVTFVMLAGLIRLLKDKGLITAPDLVATIELFLNTSAPAGFRDAAETAMLLCDDDLLQALFYPAKPAPAK